MSFISGLGNLAGLGNRNAKRIGRGPGSGCGKTGGRGMNGQKAKGKVCRHFANIWRLSHGKVAKNGTKKNRERMFVINQIMMKNKTLPKKLDFVTLKKYFKVPHYCKSIKIIGCGEKNQHFLRKKIAKLG